MARDEFDSAGDYVSVKDLVGRLVLFAPFEYVEEVETAFGTKDAILTDVVDLTEGRLYEENMIFQGAMIGALKRKIGDPRTGRPSRMLLGVVAKGEAKKNQAAPYVLNTPTDEQKAVAREWLKSSGFEQRQPIVAGAVAQPVAAPAATQPVASQPATPAAATQSEPSPDDPWAV